MPKVQKTVLNRVEGEIELKLIWENGKIKDAFIIAPNFRGFEFILRGKPAEDALVITPRICGICGHAHLIATVRGLEDVYRSLNIELEVPQNANLIRELTLGAEIVQNHIRWFYLFVLPDFLKLSKNKKLKKYEPIKGYQWRKAVDFSSRIVKVISVFGGQWPHTSYAVVGGVTSDPTTFEIAEAVSHVDALLRFAEDNILGMSLDSYLSVETLEQYLENSKESDLKTFVKLCLKHGLHRTGRAYHRFLTVCEMEHAFSKGATKRKKKDFDIKKVSEEDSYSFLTENGFSFDPHRYSWAKAVRYEGVPYETSPLARRVNSGDRLFLNLLKKYRDSYLVRTWARIDEIIKILTAMKKWLSQIDIKESFYTKPSVSLKKLSGTGNGLCEAARGSLIHQVNIKNGKILSYNIITPSTWNLGPRCENYPSPAEKAIKSADSLLKAEIILRSFDVCSVCTTH
ncbi:nickel-dependent hydrogenase large subunit [Persephonella sp.]